VLTLILSEVWTVNDLIERVGPIERPVALKALLAWVDRGVLREENDEADIQRFRLLESAPTDVGSVPVGMTTAGSRVALTEEQPAVLTVQQQQADQMKVYWKVRSLVLYLVLCPECPVGDSSSRVCSRIWADYHWTAFRRCSSLRRVMTAHPTSWAYLWTRRVARVLSTSRTEFGASIGNKMPARSVLRFFLESEEAQSERRKRHFSFGYSMCFCGRFLGCQPSSGHEELSFASVKRSIYKAAQDVAEKRRLDLVSLVFDERYCFVLHGCGVSTSVKKKKKNL
jgi:hypothetical protein